MGTYTYKFNLDEIFKIAVQIERNGAEFYRNASMKFEDNQKIKRLLLELAVQEDSHEKTFSEILHKVLKNEGINSEDELTRQYLDAIAGQFVFNKASEECELINDMSRQEVFDVAIVKEKDSIVFYVGLKNALTSEHSKNSIDFIIEEEQKHLVELRKYAEILKYADNRF